MLCECGNDRFYAGQRCHYSVIVDEYGTWEENVCCEDSDDPYGPFTCTKCSKEYDDLY